jgi:hypothetical protein
LLPSVSTPNSPARAWSSGFFLDLRVVDISAEQVRGVVCGDVCWREGGLQREIWADLRASLVRNQSGISAFGM